MYFPFLPSMEPVLIFTFKFSDGIPEIAIVIELSIPKYKALRLSKETETLSLFWPCSALQPRKNNRIR